MKLNVNQEKCIGCGACVAIAPENFDFDEEGLSKVISDEVTEKTKSAEEACPVYAILIDAESNVKQFPGDKSTDRQDKKNDDYTDEDILKEAA